MQVWLHICQIKDHVAAAASAAATTTTTTTVVVVIGVVATTTVVVVAAATTTTPMAPRCTPVARPGTPALHALFGGLLASFCLVVSS